MDLDGSVYPDRDPPEALDTAEERADYLQRICGAFDHGIPPEEKTLRLLATWRTVFDLFPLVSSPAYHALRAYFGWPAVERAPFFSEPVYAKFDRLEGRSDPCADRV
jgi:hypothetical protein